MGSESTKVRSPVLFRRAVFAFWRIAFPASPDVPAAVIDFAGKPDRTRRRLWSLETMAVVVLTFAKLNAAFLAAGPACAASTTTLTTKPTTA